MNRGRILRNSNCAIARLAREIAEITHIRFHAYRFLSCSVSLHL